MLVLPTLERLHHVVGASGEALDRGDGSGLELRGGLIGSRGPL